MAFTYSLRGEQVYKTAELALLIHEQCDIGILSNIAICDRGNRRQIIHFIKKRFADLLVPYMALNGM